MKELAMVIRKVLLFLIIDANLPIDCKVIIVEYKHFVF